MVEWGDGRRALPITTDEGDPHASRGGPAPALAEHSLPYDPHELERRWRARWEAEPDGLSSVDLDATPAESLFYNLAEFPYPSAEGLHVGHVFKYCGLDAYGRLQRMRGRAVFQPIGFDAFGIHAENFALRTGEHPRTLTARTTANFARQLSSIGCSWDWERVLDTSRPAYYRWTQWLLTGCSRRADVPGGRAGALVPVMPDRAGARTDGGGRDTVRALRFQR